MLYEVTPGGTLRGLGWGWSPKRPSLDEKLIPCPHLQAPGQGRVETELVSNGQ